MESLWNSGETESCRTDLALRVYTSRLLGRDSSLVLHGGGNTSLKVTEKNILGEEEDILYVKGSGWDLATIEEPGFAPVRMKHLLELAKLDSLSDPKMVNELKTGMTKALAPSPSVETILHAILPFRYVDHTHADAVVTVTNTDGGMERVREIYGDLVVIIPYVMPGFDLARECARRFSAEAGGGTIGMILMNHGVFSFGGTARESYERMIRLVGMAEDYLKKNGAWDLKFSSAEQSDKALRIPMAELRGKISAAAGFPVILAADSESKSLSFARREDVPRISQSGPATPDHVIRTKRVPMIGRNVDAYVREYRKYFEEHAKGHTMLDPAPRVVIDREFGVCSVGQSAKAAGIVADLYRHTIDVISRAEALGGYKALSARDIFDVEYWDLEQAKLRKAGRPPLFAGEVALVTGAASGIGKACVESLLNRGSAVVGLDINEDVVKTFTRPDFLGLACDITDEEAVRNALEKTAQAFGGLDMLILSAGIFPAGQKISGLETDIWRKTMTVNLDANLFLMRESHPLLKLAPSGGRVVLIGSKNVPAPGPGAAAYSASKAALVQLMRVAALEWGSDGIRLNCLHPHGVFDTGIWTDEVLKSRADSYGLTVEEYKTNNILKVEITSRQVADLAAEMCGPLFSGITAAQLPIDGGNERVI
jgi:rhamnose utilization protein RhaD (predicted bifunctional aldolase and dehydrogenase)/NAD(P)-dependent dehydrogenase (short-subunit alcohol dehydrogenase family)